LENGGWGISEMDRLNVVRFVSVVVFALFLQVLSGCDSNGVSRPPVAPLQLSPIDGVANTENAIVLVWALNAEADSYELELASDASFANVIVHEPTLFTGEFTVTNLNLGSTYFWRVRASNENGVGDWSSIWTFTPTRIAVPPSVPNLSYPPPGRTGMPTEVILKWDTVPGATSYHLQLSVEPNFWRNEVDLDGIENPQFDVPGLIFGYIYYWRVRAGSAAGFSEWSPVWTFIVVTG
jgi:Fibronectin type III domain